MTAETDVLWRYIDTIRRDSPTTPNERIEYVKNVIGCTGIINKLYVTKNEYMRSLLEPFYNKNQELIIGVQYSKSITPSKCAKIKEIYNNKCAICGFPVGKILEVHHIIPKSMCGKNESSNLIALCPTCHVIFHDIEQNGAITEELRMYLAEQNQLECVVEYTKHLLTKNVII